MGFKDPYSPDHIPRNAVELRKIMVQKANSYGFDVDHIRNKLNKVPTKEAMAEIRKSVEDEKRFIERKLNNEHFAVYFNHIDCNRHNPSYKFIETSPLYFFVLSKMVRMMILKKTITIIDEHY
jgi:hypothetical protein